jgi:uncharacterized repeat protein (TIGR01451 family)/CSLREA domain-containing protein
MRRSTARLRYAAYRCWLWLFGAALMLPLASPQPALAAVVTACTEAGLDAALAATPAGGTVRFACGGPATVVVARSKRIVTNLTIRGDGLITISGGRAVRIFAVDPTVALRLDGLTISDGAAAGDVGGGVLNRGLLSLDGVVFTNNSANSGGAVYNTGVVTATASVFQNNTASVNGGSIANTGGGRVTLDDTLIQGGSAGVLGGGIYNTGVITLTNSAVRNNRASFGAGIQSAAGSVALIGTTVSANNATQDAGGVQNGGVLTIDGSSIDRNTASVSAGGIDNSGAVTLANTTISGNSAALHGGGIANLGDLRLNNATIANNSADSDGDGGGDGGGVFNNIGSAFVFTNTILAGNSDRGEQAPDCAGALTSGGHNLIQRIAGCAITSASGDRIGANPQIGLLADNGGRVPTHALLAGSPAIDAGNQDTCELRDQRGVARPRDGDGVGPPVCDIGAYELGFVVNTTADAPDANLADGLCKTANGACTLRAAVQQANSAAFLLDAITFGVSQPLTLTIKTDLSNTTPSATGPLRITDDLIISGRGAGQTIVDGGRDPDIGGVFHIASAARVTIADLTVRNGNAGGNTYGGAIRNEGALDLRRSVVSGSAATSAGGVANWGVLSVDGSTISGNTATSGGGGIQNLFDVNINPSGGQLDLAASTISANAVTGALGGGGGVDNQAVARLTNVTISGNQAAQDGGGMRVWANDLDATIANNVTIVGNIADSDHDGVGAGGGIFGRSGPATIMNTIVAGNVDRSGKAPDCQGQAAQAGYSLVSLGHNLIGDNTGCAIVARAGDQVGTGSRRRDPRLSPLRDNGGPTATRAPLSGSPAINAGSLARPGSQGDACVAADQRGLLRPQGATCDIGASEAILANLRIAQAASPDPVLAGWRLTYRVDVTNAGPSPTNGVVVTDTLPLNVSLISATASVGQCSGNKPVICAVGRLVPGSTATITIVVVPLVAPLVSNLTGAIADEADPSLADNLARRNTAVRYALHLPLVMNVSRIPPRGSSDVGAVWLVAGP